MDNQVYFRNLKNLIMKTIRLTLLGSIISLFAIVACQRNLQEELLPTSDNTVNQRLVSQRLVNQATVINANPYSITLIGPNQVNENWEWVWAIKNNNPGNGKNGTVQDLSHWGMASGTCLDWTSVLAAAYSSDGIHWTSFTPTLRVDPTSCLIEPVLKFDFGTKGSNTSYFRLILNKYYPVGSAYGYYKSGRNTGCIPFYFSGIDCSASE
jgi:hypothetical protein